MQSSVCHSQREWLISCATSHEATHNRVGSIHFWWWWDPFIFGCPITPKNEWAPLLCVASWNVSQGGVGEDIESKRTRVWGGGVCNEAAYSGWQCDDVGPLSRDPPKKKKKEKGYFIHKNKCLSFKLTCNYICGYWLSRYLAVHAQPLKVEKAHLKKWKSLFGGIESALQDVTRHFTSWRGSSPIHIKYFFVTNKNIKYFFRPYYIILSVACQKLDQLDATFEWEDLSFL